MKSSLALPKAYEELKFYVGNVSLAMYPKCSLVLLVMNAGFALLDVILYLE